MAETDFYYTIDRSATAEFKDRGSKFLAVTFPVQTVEECKRQLETVKKDHPKANHHCFAYRLGLDNYTFRVSDDGEPCGTAGKPILGQIDSRQLTNILVVVVRYFGGTLLGVPGLINAYKTATALALQVTPIVQRTIELKYILQFDYTQVNDVMMIVKQLNCTVHRQEMNLFCRFIIGIPRARLEEALHRFNDIRDLDMVKTDGVK